MLPKFATTVLHHTSRAVAAVQSQTGHAFRNALQSSSGGTTTANWTGASSSGWGGAGAGTGGAKYHSSSRFYGYTGAGRAITQANQSSVNDIGSSQNDDEEINLAPGVTPTTLRRRARSNSLSISPQEKADRADKLGVLKIVSIHARESHAFAPNHADESDASRPTLVRRNSTSSAATSGSPPSSNVEIPPSSVSTERLPVGFLDPEAPQTVVPPLDNNSEQIRSTLYDYTHMKLDMNILSYVQNLMDKDIMPVDGPTYNLALQALLKDRASPPSVTLLMRIYKVMKKNGHAPTSWNHANMIQALGRRDVELQFIIRTVNGRVVRRRIGNRSFGKQHEVDLELLERFKKEDNLGPAIELFQDAIASSLNIPRFVYTSLIRSCAIRSDEYAALRVFSHLEKHHKHQIPVAAFYHLLSIYANLRNLDSALETFNEFKKAFAEGRVVMKEKDDVDVLVSSDSPWNKMIQVYFNCGQPTEALSILEEMMDSKSGYPLPSSSTYQTIISGFCENGDTNTALSWFRRLLKEETVVTDAYEPLDKPPRPNGYMYRYMTTIFADNQMVQEANEVFDAWLDDDLRGNSYITPADRLLVVEANLTYMEDHPERTLEADSVLLDFILHRVAPDTKDWGVFFGTRDSYTCSRIIKMFERHGQIDKAVTLLVSYVNDQKIAISEDSGNEILMRVRLWLRQLVNDTVERLLIKYGEQLTFAQATDLISLLSRLSLSPSVDAADAYLAVYEAGKANGTIGTLDKSVVEFLVSAGATIAFVKTPRRGNDLEIAARLVRFESLVADIPMYCKELTDLAPSLFSNIIRALLVRYPLSELHRVFEKLGPAWQTVWNYSVFQDELRRLTAADEHLTAYVPAESPPTISPDPQGPSFTFSGALSHSIAQCLSSGTNPKHAEAYELFMSSYRYGVYPQLETLGHLINVLGRVQEIEKVRFVYEAAQHAMSVQAQNGTPDSSAWFAIESDMIIALSHAGDIDGAHSHRHRILQYGGAPTADAYGALIRCVKDTTDDSSIAQELFRESTLNGVTPNVYLFNTMISKLAKARKASQAMELFETMKANGYWPSSVTYGAVIGACSRVGDYNTADKLFHEMSIQANFKPRIPPYNIMMQLYTYTKPNRGLVLDYFNKLVSAGIKPTAHTYKLLMDAYGTIAPVDLVSMDTIFKKLCSDRSVSVQGTHWGALINAHGCVNKDLDRAIEIFESISTHPTTVKNKALPDAVTYESLINVFVTLRRADLIPKYIDRLRSSGIHMTAYIANLLIKGYAVTGDLEKARNVFESLVDPPKGVAASHNHTPHDSDRVSRVDPNAPIYREPSTWEAMVRAELSNGNRDHALALLERMKERQFPAAVNSRISGIMLDDSVSPWPAPSTSSTSPDISS